MTDIKIEKTDPETGKKVTFAIGEAKSVLDGREMIGYSQYLYWNGRFYEPPVKPQILGKLVNVAPHHRSAIGAKRKFLVRDFIPSKYLSRREFGDLVYDYLVLGNCYIERVKNMLGEPLILKTSKGLFTRKGKDNRFFFIQDNYQVHEFERDSVFHIMETDINQEVYGTPEYLGALHSALLNESATVFRRRYFINGSHAGFILFLTADDLEDRAAEKLADQVLKTKGVGNFNNAFMHAPGSDPNALKLIHVGEQAAKDEFLNIKNVSAKDIMAAHRVPPQLLGIVPEAAGGFGDVAKANDVYNLNEIIPLQDLFLEINDWLGAEAVKFKPFEPLSKDGAGNQNNK